MFNGFDGGGAKEHITLTPEFCGTKMSLGVGGGEVSVEITGSGETGVTQEERLIVVCID